MGGRSDIARPKEVVEERAGALATVSEWRHRDTVWADGSRLDNGEVGTRGERRKTVLISVSILELVGAVVAGDYTLRQSISCDGGIKQVQSICDS